MEKNHQLQDYKQWNLPEDARARLGKGGITGNIAYSPDGSRLIVPSTIGIWIYDADTLEENELITAHRGFNSSVVGFTSSGHLLASGFISTWDGYPPYVGEIQIWDEDTKHSKVILICPEDGKVTALTFCPDGRTLVSGSTDGKIRLWDVHTAKLRNTLIGHTEIISSLVFSSDGCTLVSIDKNDTVLFWNVDTGEPLTTQTRQMWGFVFNSDGSRFAVCKSLPLEHPERTIIELQDMHTGNKCFIYTGSITSNLVFSPDSKMLACAVLSKFDNTSPIGVWDITANSLTYPFRWLSGHTSSVSNLAFSPNGRTLASASQDGTVLLWDIGRSSDISIPDTIQVIYPDSPNVSPDKNQAIITEGTAASLSPRSYEIWVVCKNRGITTLVHFTRIENLCSILGEGLLSRSILETREHEKVIFNDPQRWDGHKDANCLSISFPNYQMFYSIRKRKRKKQAEGISDSQWVVLLLDTKVLWELDCAFCQQNAAHRTVSSISLEERKKPEAIKEMFEDFYDIRRQDLQIPENYPTHPQSEVLVFEPIPMQYITAIHFSDATTLNKWRSNYSTGFSYSSVTSVVNQQYFEPRQDYEKWRPPTFNEESIPISDYGTEYNKYEPDENVDKDDIEDDIPF